MNSSHVRAQDPPGRERRDGRAQHRRYGRGERPLWDILTAEPAIATQGG